LTSIKLYSYCTTANKYIMRISELTPDQAWDKLNRPAEVKTQQSGQDARKIYAIGDSHAEGLAYNPRVINRANGGQPSTSKTNYGGLHTIKQTPVGLDNVPPNQIVIIAQGANDTANSMRNHKDNRVALVDPKRIAANVARVVSTAQSQGHKVVFVLFPNGSGRGSGLATYYAGEYQERVREAIRSAVGVPVVDLDGKGLSPDGIHSTASAYKSAADDAIALAR
jgi:hypothetical protein